MQDLLKPGDRFIIQQCHYSNTLEKIRKEDILAGSFPFSENPACLALINWGSEHSVKISLRCL